MVDTIRTRDELTGLLPDNTSGEISAQDMRDVLISTQLRESDYSINITDESGVNLSANNGVFTISGMGDGTNEALSFDFDNTSNSIEISSPTSVTTLDFGSLNLIASGIKVSNSTGVNLSAADGKLTMKGLKTAGENEDLSFDFETANTVIVASSTGVVKLGLSGMSLGVKTNAPKASLHVVGTNTAVIPAKGTCADSTDAIFTEPSLNYGLLVGVLNSCKCWIQSQRTDGNTTVYDLLLQPNGGNVGINVTSASAQLHVGGAIACTGAAFGHSTTTPVMANVVSGVWLPRTEDITNFTFLDWLDELFFATERGYACTSSTAPDVSFPLKNQFYDDTTSAAWASGTSPSPLSIELDCTSSPIPHRNNAYFNVGLTIRSGWWQISHIKIETYNGSGWGTAYDADVTLAASYWMSPRFLSAHADLRIHKLRVTFTLTTPLTGHFYVQRLALYHATGELDPWHLHIKGGTVYGTVKAAGFISSDGSAGLTQSVTVRNAADTGTTTLTFKNGLLTAVA